jgi:hypothetical protein
MHELLRTRWQERDIALSARFQAVISQMAGRNMLYSTVLVQELFKVACDEFNGSRQAIVATVIDSLSLGNVKLNREKLLDSSIAALDERRKSIDGQFRSRAKVSGMLDSGIIRGQVDLSSKMEAAVNEMKVELVRALDEYQNKNSDTLKDQILRKLFNVPLVAWLVIAVVVVAALVSLVSDIVSLVNGS